MSKIDPLLVCVIMIKNEAPVIKKTLKAMVDGGIDSFLIYDTGSTDNTIDIVHDYFASCGIINYAIEQEEFVDFATSRNRALDLVDSYFPQATFILMPDAEWILYNGSGLLTFCQEHKHETQHASYLIRLIYGSSERYVDRLIRARSGVRFRSPVHEYLHDPSKAIAPRELYMKHDGTTYGIEKTRKRFERDVGLLLKEYAQNPHDARTVFYLAQTYDCLEDCHNAFRFYELRTEIKSWDYEENFMAMYRLAQVVEKIAERDTNQKTYGWALAEWYYLKAFSMRPSRIEPLIKIAKHYLDEKQYALAFLFAERASQIPYPESDLLFVEKEIYECTRYDILGQAAWYIGEYDVGKWAIKKALEQRTYPHLLANLAFYEKPVPSL